MLVADYKTIIKNECPRKQQAGIDEQNKPQTDP